MNSSKKSTPDPHLTSQPSVADIEAAAERLAGSAVRTPLLESPALNEVAGGRVLLKAETFQRTGSFKFRGAYNRISRIPEDRRSAGVVSFSSGNHAQGVAAAAALLETPATIVMPRDAPAIKLSQTKAYGANIVLYDRYSESREAMAESIAEETGGTLVSPYDDLDIITGQGTCGLEIARQAEALGARIDQVLVCCGGGGLVAGCATALKALIESCEVFAVEPEEFDDTRRSLIAGKRLGNDPGARSICDALLAEMPGEVTFEINRRLLSGALAVSDADVRSAMAYAFRRLKLVVEPGGAVTLAALLKGKIETAGRTTVLVLTGGNVDADLFADIITSQSDT